MNSKRAYKGIIPAMVLALASAVWGLAAPGEEPEPAPIVEHRLDFYDFSYKAIDGSEFNLRSYAEGKRLVIVSFIAGWCKNSIENGHVIKRLYNKYKDRGLGLVAVTEYSTPEEIRIYANRVGADYPMVTETGSLGARKESKHYGYRKAVSDRRKWGTPFHVIIDARDIEPKDAKAPLARRVYTVSGEIVEKEAEEFIEKKLSSQTLVSGCFTL